MQDNKFTITEQNKDDIQIINLHGFLDAHTAPDLESKLSETLQSGKYKIVVNFNDLEYISSAGLGVFMAFIEEAREKGGDIKLCCMKERVFSVFDLLGFPILFDIVQNEEEAIQNFLK